MPQLAIAPTFLDEFRHLDRSVQSATLSVLNALMRGEHPPLGPPAGALDDRVRILRIGPEWSGVVIPTTDEAYCLLTVRPHDEAVSFARSCYGLDRPALELAGDTPQDAPVDVGAPPVLAPAEIAAALTADLATWRVTVHPEQQRLIAASRAGPARLSGGPGTGKTVVLLHRAAHLARQDEARRSALGHRPILVTTRGELLAQMLSRWLDDLVDDPEVRQRIEVSTVDSLARSVVHGNSGAVPEVLDRDSVRQRWRDHAAADGLPYSGRFLVDEWEQVILAHQLTEVSDYVRAERRGRLTHLAPEYRPQVWEAIDRYTVQMRTQRRLSRAQLAAEAARILGSVGPMYRHILVDETQQLHPAHLRMLRAAAPRGHNDLFLVGDPRLATVDWGVSLRAVGVEVQGRAQRLRNSYRSTREILGWADDILGRGRTATGAPSTLPHPHSVLRGPQPRVYAATSRAAEYAAMVSRVKSWLEGGLEGADIAVAGRNRWIVRSLTKELQACGIATAPAGAGPHVAGVRAATLHQLNGLEFRCVGLAGLSDPLLPPRAALDTAEGDTAGLEQELARERALLYTACTRARDALYVSYVNRPSALLPRLG
ncbi:AAA family ATPase [Lipingzhangella sp. LS1_29]|uniref:DNA 3'-5' helicase n=1 Tax=Lipingzhangella rawalii TaxID=2055835 RepID=A0ABU2HBA5_9ACTN|nr:UvrD-helicase domain-containing protein [Lipingzhangella rawalii]MDS1272609.1 AAA family ATPase [Lipingzhangella rawalii]